MVCLRPQGGLVTPYAAAPLVL